MKHLFFISLLAVLFSGCEKSASTDPIPEQGIPLSLAEKRVSNIDQVQYDLFFNIPKNKSEEIKSFTKVSLVMKSLSDLVFDFNSENGTIDSILQEGKKIEFIDTNQHIIIPNKYFSEGQGQVELTLYFTAGNLSLNRNDDFLYTLLVPARASTVFPLFDQPNIKAKFKLSLEIPSEWIAQTNGELINSKDRGDKRKYLEFEQSEPIPSYLFAFSAGEFEEIKRTVDGLEMTMLHRENDSLKVKNNLDDIFQSHLSAVRWLEEYTGIDYPFSKFGFTLVPSFQYGGMEHPGAIFYNANSLFLDENASINRKLGRARLIAHETAHMWFGDLVTMNWFDDVWLKEVFANFMAAKIVNPQFPEIDHDLRFILSHYRNAYEVDRTEGTHPVRQTLSNLNNAGSLYGAIIYQKAPILMKHLEMMIGEQAMQNGLGDYLKTYSYGNATWDNLVAILDKQTEHNVTDWSKNWVYGKGMPVIEPSRDEKNVSFQPEQLTGSQEITYGLYHLLATDSTNQTNWKINPSSNDNPSQEIESQTIIWPNITGFGYGYFKMDSLSKNFMLSSVLNTEDPIMRASSWINLMEAVLRGDITPQDMLESLYDAIPQEKEDQILDMLIGFSGNIYWTYIPSEQRQLASLKWETLFWNLMESSSKPDRKIVFFRAFRNVVLSGEGLEKLIAVQKEELNPVGLTLSENDRISNVNNLALKTAPGWDELLKLQYENVKNPDRKKRMTFVMPALSNNKTIRDEFFESLKMAENREREPWVQEALGFLNHPIRQHDALNSLKPGLELVEEIQATGDIFFPQRWISALFSGHNSKEAANIIKTFIEENKDYDDKLMNKIKQEADAVFRKSEILGAGTE